MNPKVIYKNSLNGKNIVIRYPQSEDLVAMHKYINLLSKERTSITYQGEKIELDDEASYLKSQLKKIEDKNSVQLLLFVDNELSGISSIDLEQRVAQHIGIFGISVVKKNRRIGLGKLLMDHILREAKNNLSKLKIITLEVMEINSNAINMYNKFGFQIYGNLPDGNIYKGHFINTILMYKRNI